MFESPPATPRKLGLRGGRVSVGTMDTLEARLFAAQLRSDLPIVDLHGLSGKAAIEQLDLFLDKARLTNSSAVRAVYGFGAGVLEKVVCEWLQKQSWVDTIAKESGSCIVIIK